MLSASCAIARSDPANMLVFLHRSCPRPTQERRRLRWNLWSTARCQLRWRRLTPPRYRQPQRRQKRADAAAAAGSALAAAPAGSRMNCARTQVHPSPGNCTTSLYHAVEFIDDHLCGCALLLLCSLFRNVIRAAYFGEGQPTRRSCGLDLTQPDLKLCMVPGPCGQLGDILRFRSPVTGGGGGGGPRVWRRPYGGGPPAGAHQPAGHLRARHRGERLPSTPRRLLLRGALLPAGSSAPPLRHSPAAGRPTAAWMPPILQHLHNGGPSSVLVLVSS